MNTIDVSGRWAGSFQGTNQGYVFVDLQQDGDRLRGNVRLEDIHLGHTRASLEGTISQGMLLLQLSNFEGPQEQHPQIGTIRAQVGASGQVISGEWQTDLGTQGTATLQRYVRSPQVQQQAPLGFLTKTRQLRAYKLDRQSLATILGEAMSDTHVLVPTFAYEVGGRTVTNIGIEQFARNLPREVLNDLTITISEPAVGAGYRVVTLNFKKYDANTALVMAESPLWVEGKIAQIEDVLRTYELRWNFFYRRYANELNALIFLLMLIILPSIESIPNRAIFVGLIVLILWALVLVYRRVFPMTVIHTQDAPLSWWQKHGDKIIGGFASAVASAIVVAIVRFFLG
ncbi:MAG: hypothetical protein ACE5JJ_05615 [Nitrospinota bacterium]